jgi:hypothetical protein
MPPEPMRLLGKLIGSLLCLACSRSEAPKLEPAPSAAPSSAEAVAAAAVASVLTSVRSRISLAAPAWEQQPLAFGRQLLARTAGKELEVLALPALTSVMKVPLADARGVLEIAGGSLVAVGATAALRIDPGAKAPVRLPPVPWLPGTLLLPERRDSQLLWSVQTVGRLFVRQRLDLDPTRSFDKEVTPEGYDGGPVTVLRDGAFLYRAKGGVRRAMPEGRSVVFKSELVPWRLLPGRRVDQAWVVAEDGTVELWQLGDRIAVQLRFAAGAAPFAAAASAQYLALVVVDEPAGSQRKFRLLAYDNEGARVLERVLPPGEPEIGEGWEAIAVRDRHVALADADPFVAVGGPTSLEVFRLPDGERLLSR